MPMYDYICLECQNRFERIRSSKEADAPQDCPTCKSQRVKRRLAVVAAFAREGTSMPAQAGGGCCGGSCGCGTGHRLN